MEQDAPSCIDISGVLQELVRLERVQAVDYIPDIGLLFEECRQLAQNRADDDFWVRKERIVDLFSTHPSILSRAIYKWFSDKFLLFKPDTTIGIHRSPLATYKEYFFGDIRIRIIQEASPPMFPKSVMIISAIDMSDLIRNRLGRYEVMSPRNHMVWIGTDPEGKLERFWAGC